MLSYQNNFPFLLPLSNNIPTNKSKTPDQLALKIIIHTKPHHFEIYNMISIYFSRNYNSINFPYSQRLQWNLILNMFNWFCCKKDNKRQIFPEAIYSLYTKVDASHRKIAEQQLRYDPTRAPHQYRQWSHTKIKSKNINDMMDYLESKKTNFIDEDFPHSYPNISKQPIKEINIEWMRVQQLAKNPIFIKRKQGIDLASLQKYKTNNRAFRNALILIARAHSWKINHVLMQNLSDKGIYQFKLFKNGIIHNVIIDDYVPTVNKIQVFSGPLNGNQVYPMLLEKAIAKLCGGYSEIPSNPLEIMQMIHCGAALKDQIESLESLEDLQLVIKSYLEVNGLVMLTGKQSRQLRNFGINQSQIYQIVNCHQVSTQIGPQLLLELVSESKMSAWNGKFNMIDPIWKQVDEQKRLKIMREIQKNQSFCLPFKEISRVFKNLIVFKDTDSNNKQWFQYYSQRNSLSSCQFQIQEDDHVFMRINTQQSISQFLIVAKIESNQYQYKGGSSNQYTRHLDFQGFLEKGKYLIVVFQDWNEKKEGEYTVYMSSGTRAYLNRYDGQMGNFIQQICLKDQSAEIINDHVCYGFVPSTGLAYLKVTGNKNQGDSEVNKIKIIRSELETQGWSIIEPYNDIKQVIVGQKTIIIVIRADCPFTEPNKKFPLEGFRVQFKAQEQV